MDQQHGFPPPPPPPQVSASPRAGNTPYFTQERRQPGPAQPSSITTNFLRTQGFGSLSQTPASAVSPGHSALPYSPGTPSVVHPRTPVVGYPDAGHSSDSPSRGQLQSPGSLNMAQQPYNPRQWSGHGSHLAYSQQPSPLSRGNVEVTGMEGKFNCNGGANAQLSAWSICACRRTTVQVRCLRRIFQLRCLHLHLHTLRRHLTQLAPRMPHVLLP